MCFGRDCQSANPTIPASTANAIPILRRVKILGGGWNSSALSSRRRASLLAFAAFSFSNAAARSEALRSAFVSMSAGLGSTAGAGVFVAGVDDAFALGSGGGVESVGVVCTGVSVTAGALG